MPETRARNILLLENDGEDAETRKKALERVSDYPFLVDVGPNEDAARDLIVSKWSEGHQYDFLLADLFLDENSLRPEVIGDVDVFAHENGCEVTRRLLAFARSTYGSRPNSAQQLRTVVYSASRPFPDDEARLRTEILNMGAHDFISCRAKDMQEVITRLADMCALQEELLEIEQGDSWVTQIMQKLGIGISIIGRNWKIWYCNRTNAEFSGIRLDSFLDRVCWYEYHGFCGRTGPCPECPAARIITVAMAEDEERQKVLGDPYPFAYEKAGLTRCDRLAPVGNLTDIVPIRGTRLLPLQNGELKWVHVVAYPLLDSSKTRVIGAVETVVDLHNLQEGYLDAKQLSGDLTAADRLEPVLGLVNWMGYSRARIFEMSEDTQEVVGVSEVGNLLRVREFVGYSLPTSETLFGRWRGDFPPAEGIYGACCSHGTRVAEFHKEGCTNYAEFALWDSFSDNVDEIGTLVLDNVDEKTSETNPSRGFQECDLDRLRAFARYVGHVLSIANEYRTQTRRKRHAESFRTFSEELSEEARHVAAAEPNSLSARWEELTAWLCDRVRTVVQGEPGEREVIGYHLRFLNFDDQLVMFPGYGAYSTIDHKGRTVEIGDLSSMSAKCLRTREPDQTDRVEAHAPLQRFRAYLEQHSREIDPDTRAAAQKWLTEVRSVACLPMLWGEIGVGVMAVQSSARDFFGTETVTFLQDLCDAMARRLGPLHEKHSRYRFWENAAYAFRGPAQTLASVSAGLLRNLEESSPLLSRAEGVCALSHYIHSKAMAFQFAAVPARSLEKAVETEPYTFAEVWPELRAIFHGLTFYGRKRFICEVDAEGIDRRKPADYSLQVNRLLLIEMVFNVYENAAKACRERVSVVLEAEPGYILLKIDDDGRGFSAEAMEHMFEDGFTEDFQNDWPAGKGLGLKWTKFHADRTGVRLVPQEVEGALGGASFWIYLPATTEE